MTVNYCLAVMQLSHENCFSEILCYSFYTLEEGRWTVALQHGTMLLCGVKVDRLVGE